MLFHVQDDTDAFWIISIFYVFYIFFLHGRLRFVYGILNVYIIIVCTFLCKMPMPYIPSYRSKPNVYVRVQK